LRFPQKFAHGNGGLAAAKPHPDVVGNQKAKGES
jgi:hypothetical protein